MPNYPNPEVYWRSTRARDHARAGALAYARAEMTRRRAAGAIAKQSLLQIHSGRHHLDFFRDQFPQLIAKLPPNFRAIEVGAGMAWQAALLAAHSSGSVVATEITFDQKTPYHLDNVHVLYRLCEHDPALSSLLEFHTNQQDVTSVTFDPRLQFARADAAGLPFATATADLLYSNNCLEHLPDLESAFREAARVLKPGGLLFGSTEPLYFSAQGHHLSDFFPIPWGHLLWHVDELAEIVLREGEPGREWEPGDVFSARHVNYILGEILNYTTPVEFRSLIRCGPWRVEAWLDIAHSADKTLAREIHLFDALTGIPTEALLLTGLRFHLRRDEAHPRIQIPLLLDHITRSRIRRLLPRKLMLLKGLRASQQ